MTLEPRPGLSARRSAPSALVGALFALVICAGLVLASATSVAAHDTFMSSYPQADSTLSGSPAEITLSFSGELISDTQSAVVEVIAPGGQDIATDAPQIGDVFITQHLAPSEADGVFTVRWKVVSQDGHPISGEFVYTVDPVSSPETTPIPGATGSSSAEPPPTEDSTGGVGHGEPSGGGAILPAIALVSGVVIVGGVLFVVLMVRRERRRRDQAAAAPSAVRSATRKDDADGS